MIVDPIEEGEKVKAEISSILYKDNIQHLKKQQQWWVQHTNTQSDVPITHVLYFLNIYTYNTAFSNQLYNHFYIFTPYRPEGFMEELPVQDKTSNQQQEEEEEGPEEDAEHSGNSEDDDSDLFVNTNRCNYQFQSEEEDSEEEDDK